MLMCLPPFSSLAFADISLVKATQSKRGENPIGRRNSICGLRPRNTTAGEPASALIFFRLGAVLSFPSWAWGSTSQILALLRSISPSKMAHGTVRINMGSQLPSRMECRTPNEQAACQFHEGIPRGNSTRELTQPKRMHMVMDFFQTRV